MRRITTCLLLLFAAAGCLYMVSDVSAATEDRHCVLRVTSAQPGTEYAFEGAYISRLGDGHLKLLEGETPFEVQISSDVAAAILRAKSPDGRLQVRMVGLHGAKEKSVSTGTGQSFIVETGVTQGGGSIRVF